MDKVTKFSYAGAREVRLGGTTHSAKGGQPLAAPRIASNWYPVNLPSASNGTPAGSDINTLLGLLTPHVARLTIAQSVALASSYRQVQSVAPGGNFTLAGATASGVTSLFDQNIQIGETVAVDVVNKNPALSYDLAVRLAAQTASALDTLLLGQYATFSPASVGSAGTTPTASNLATIFTELAATGEPVITVLKTATYAAMEASGAISSASGKNGQPPLFFNTQRGMRIHASDAVATVSGTPNTNHNLCFYPSAMALCSADMGTSFGSNGQPGFVTGTVYQQTSSFLDPEFGTPQLVLQLVVGNTGSGAQTVWVNALAAPLVVNAAGGAQLLS